MKKYKITYDNKMINAILFLMKEMNWKWRNEEVTYKMVKKTIKTLLKSLMENPEHNEVSTGGIVVSRDEEIPEFINVKFEVNIAYPKLKK